MREKLDGKRKSQPKEHSNHGLFQHPRDLTPICPALRINGRASRRRSNGTALSRVRHTPHFELLEGGTVVKEIVLFEFPSVEIAKRWYTNPAYQEMDCSRKVSLRQQSTRLILKRAAMRCNYLAKVGQNYTQIHRLKFGNPLFGEWFGLSTKQN